MHLDYKEETVETFNHCKIEYKRIFQPGNEKIDANGLECGEIEIEIKEEDMSLGCYGEDIYFDDVKDVENKCFNSKVSCFDNFEFRDKSFLEDELDDSKDLISQKCKRLKNEGCDTEGSYLSVDSHRDENMFECTFCEFKTNLKYSIRHHIRAVHLKLKPYTCSQCDYGSVSKCELNVHMDSAHSDFKEHKCTHCLYETSNVSSFRLHISNVHTKEGCFQCPHCEYRSNARSHYKRHLNSVHLKLKQFKCTMCSYETSEKGSLKKHNSMVHLNLKTFKCGLCNYKSSLKWLVNRHRKVHFGSKPVEMFHCGMCEYDTTKITSLKIHVQKDHLNLGAYVCNQCEFLGNNERGLHAHIDSAHSKLKGDIFLSSLRDYDVEDNASNNVILHVQ